MKLEKCLDDIENGMAGQKHAEWLRRKFNLIVATRWDRERWELRQRAALWRRVAKRLRDDLEHESAMLKFVRDSHDECADQRDEARADAVKVAQECRELTQGAEYWESCYLESGDLLAAMTLEGDKLQIELANYRSSTIVWQNTALEWERLKAERDALQGELEAATNRANFAEMQVGDKYRRNKELIEEQDALEKQLDGLRARRCETCRHYIVKYMHPDRDNMNSDPVCELGSDLSECAPNGFSEWEART